MITRRWSGNGALVALAMVVIWIATGIGAYLYLGSHRTELRHATRRPDQTSKAASSLLGRLPGSLYVVQEGTLYRLQRGTFTVVLRTPGGAAGWTQPAFTPDGKNLVVVRRDYAYSDLYLIDRTGNVLGQLTHDESPTVEFNHWAFYPRPSPDGGSLFFSYDAKDVFNYYNVVFAVNSMPMPGASGASAVWTSPEQFTGGDIQPVPLTSGAVLYTKYSFDEKLGKIVGEIDLSSGPGAAGAALTPLDDDCSQPALSHDGARLAMICTGGSPYASIEVASFDGTRLGPLQTVVTEQLAAQPTWAPDGGSLVYFAPQGITGLWQLWQVQVRTSPSGAPRQLTYDLNFDASSTIAWHS